MLRGKQDKFKFFLMGMLGLLIHQFASAQENFHKEFNWGLNGGTSISSVSFNPKVRQGKLIQGVGGISIRYISENNFGIQCEINYSQRGWKEVYPDYPDIHYTRALDYIELPVLTHIYFNAGKRFRTVFNLGPQLGYLLNERTLESSIDINDENTPSYYAQKVQRRFDWGLCFGGGVELRTSSGNFILDGRYYYGLSDIFNNSKIADGYYFAASSNQIICVKITYLFKLKTKN